MYIRNSGVAQAPLSMLETMKTRLTKPPQKLFRFLAGVELPPTGMVPCRSQGYMVMLAQ